MKNVLAALTLAAVAVTAVVGGGVWTWSHHGTLTLPPTTLHGYPPPPAPQQYVKVISAASCTSSAYQSAPAPMFGTASDGTSVSVANSGAGWLTLYCDAALPAQAVAFDYAELEFYAPNQDPYLTPNLVAYLDSELVLDGDAGYLTQSFAISGCGPANLTPVYGGNRALSVCQTSGGQPFGANDAGPFAGWNQWGTLRYFSVHFVIGIPAGPPAVSVYRIIVHYEAP